MCQNMILVFYGCVLEHLLKDHFILHQKLENAKVTFVTNPNFKDHSSPSLWIVIGLLNNSITVWAVFLF